MSRFVIAAPGSRRIAVQDAVVVEDDGEGEVVPADRAVPGFVDLHCHGALGHDFGSCTADEARRVAGFHLDRGVTGLVASVATAPLDEMRAAIARLRPLVAEGVLLGIHLEGPYLSPRRRGVHAPTLLRAPDHEEIRALLDAGQGAVRIVTIAPELPGATAAIAEVVAAGAVAAAGHTDATADEMRAAVDAGVSLVTHAFNGMRPLHHRDPGAIAVALADERVTLELILDGRHVADEVVELVRRLAPGRVALVSDAMSATGCVDGRYDVAGSSVDVVGGVARSAVDGALAGSTTPLGAAVERFAALFGPSIDELAAVSSLTASRLLGLSAPLTPGTRADAVVWTESGERRVLAAGRWRDTP